ncbi:MAG TPA: phospholipid carrier-dependent glycosyltransferase [Vicinamibacterales bacterium]|nr:phospholipid carrier-dependent glycosyltransferase [Vicinamibacterales bacterium]
MPTDPRNTGAERASFGLVLALLAAGLLRFWALPHGVPFSVQVDEPEVMVRAVRMMKTGDLNPHFYDYPTLYMYMQAVVAAARFLAGAMRGEWASLAQAPHEAFYVWGRGLTAILGTATVWLLYRIGLRWGRETALLAAAMFAVMPLHVRESHFVLTDVPVAFFVTLAVLLSLRAHESATARWFALAGAAVGLAAATKYNGAVAIVVPLVCAALTPSARPSRTVAALAVLGGALGAFLLGAPYTFIELPQFLNQFARLSAEYRTIVPGSEAAWVTYLKHLRIGLGWAGSAVVIAGLGLGLIRVVTGPSRLKWLIAVLFPVVYFRFISNQNLVFARYLLPLLPLLALLGASAVVAVVRALRHTGLSRRGRVAAIVALTAFAVVPQAYTSIVFDANAARVWTTAQAYRWLIANVPKGARITIESRQILLPDAYRTSYLGQLRQRPFESFAADGVEYLVASSQCYGPYLNDAAGGPQAYPQEYADYMKIFSLTEELARFTPSADHPGPELRILRMPARASQR